MMYWTDWGTNAKIESSAMDGSLRQTLINSSLVWPNGLAIDLEQMKLYWGDAKLKKIESSNIDGTNRRLVTDNNVGHIFGFDVSGRYLNR